VKLLKCVPRSFVWDSIRRYIQKSLKYSPVKYALKSSFAAVSLNYITEVILERNPTLVIFVLESLVGVVTLHSTIEHIPVKNLIPVIYVKGDSLNLVT
jgi:hypothetical protein